MNGIFAPLKITIVGKLVVFVREYRIFLSDIGGFINGKTTVTPPIIAKTLTVSTFCELIPHVLPSINTKKYARTSGILGSPASPTIRIAASFCRVSVTFSEYAIGTLKPKSTSVKPGSVALALILVPTLDSLAIFILRLAIAGGEFVLTCDTSVVTVLGCVSVRADFDRNEKIFQNI